MTTLSGCAGSPARQALIVSLPPAPAIVPVTAPRVSPGASPKALLGSYAVALDTANGRIANFAAWYEAVRSQYENGEADQEVIR